MNAHKINKQRQIAYCICILILIYSGCKKEEDKNEPEPKQISHYGWHDSMAGEIIFSNIVAYHEWWDVEEKIFVINKEETKCFMDNQCSLNWIGGLEISPDGLKLVIAEYSCMYIANIDGSNTMMFIDSTQCFYPSWSPDGSFIAFTTNIADRISVIDYSTGNRQYYYTESEFFTALDWSPNGAKIAYISQYSNNEWNRQLNIMDIPGGEIKVIADDVGFCLEWSPNGDKIYFEDYEEYDNVINSIYENGTGLTQLINFSDYNIAGDIVLDDIVFSPDGEMIAVTTNYKDLYILDLNGIIITKIERQEGQQYRYLAWH